MVAMTSTLARLISNTINLQNPTVQDALVATLTARMVKMNIATVLLLTVKAILPLLIVTITLPLTATTMKSLLLLVATVLAKTRKRKGQNPLLLAARALLLIQSIVWMSPASLAPALSIMTVLSTHALPIATKTPKGSCCCLPHQWCKQLFGRQCQP